MGGTILSKLAIIITLVIEICDDFCIYIVTNFSTVYLTSVGNHDFIC